MHHRSHRATPQPVTVVARGAVSALLALGASAAFATEYGQVVSSTPVTAQVAVSQPQCRDELQPLPPQTSGGGALVGAVIGGVLGNAVGAGAGRAAATGLGVIAGAALGNQAEAANTPPAATTVRRCATVARYENRVIGYDVVYEYQGQRYSSRLAQDPGARIALDVSVAPAGSLAVAPPAAAPEAVYGAPPAVYGPAPVVYGPPPVYGYYYGGPQIVFGGYWGGGYRHGGHWR